MYSNWYGFLSKMETTIKVGINEIMDFCFCIMFINANICLR